MKLFLVRHGQTDWNISNKAQGQADIPLNATGILQAEELREKLKNYQFDKCYVSPLKRAVQTAEIAVGDRMDLVFDDNLKERYFGELEGTDPKTWEGDNCDRKTNINTGGMEPILDVLTRSKMVLERIKAENPPDAKVLVVGHGVLLKTLHFNIVGYTDETDFWSFHFKNGDVMEYEI
ncbi:histidine phosphatase family protein [Candidatus Saccharibacteria bacterium]|nr:histidine phosphatase family protein [Candidatus Saccharibacteria bacterium]